LNLSRVSAGSYAPLFCFARRSAFVADALMFFWAAGVNVQSGEEVAIKLV